MLRGDRTELERRVRVSRIAAKRRPELAPRQVQAPELDGDGAGDQPGPGRQRVQAVRLPETVERLGGTLAPVVDGTLYVSLGEPRQGERKATRDEREGDRRDGGPPEAG
jgi:hypothetical protein